MLQNHPQMNNNIQKNNKITKKELAYSSASNLLFQNGKPEVENNFEDLLTANISRDVDNEMKKENLDESVKTSEKIKMIDDEQTYEKEQ